MTSNTKTTAPPYATVWKIKRRFLHHTEPYGHARYAIVICILA